MLALRSSFPRLPYPLSPVCSPGPEHHTRPARQQRHQPEPRQPQRLVAPGHRTVGKPGSRARSRCQQTVAECDKRPRHEHAGQHDRQQRPRRQRPARPSPRPDADAACRSHAARHLRSASTYAICLASSQSSPNPASARHAQRIGEHPAEGRVELAVAGQEIVQDRVQVACRRQRAAKARPTAKGAEALRSVRLFAVSRLQPIGSGPALRLA